MTAETREQQPHSAVRPVQHARVLGLTVILGIAVLTLFGTLVPVSMTEVTEEELFRDASSVDLSFVVSVLAAAFLVPVVLYLAAFLAVARRRPRRADFARKLDPAHATFWRLALLVGALIGSLAGRWLVNVFPANPIGPADMVSGTWTDNVDAPSTLFRVFAPVDVARELIWFWFCLTVLALAVLAVVAIIRRALPDGAPDPQHVGG
jgi:hypothetical protein